eukprot:m.56746 g.56746  ORF g.56746 m.56746 type:complete len:191 (-) comp11576_c0_seq2:492-1064(-)
MSLCRCCNGLVVARLLAYLALLIGLASPTLASKKSEYLHIHVHEPQEIDRLFKTLPAKDFGRGFHEVFTHVRLVPTVPENACEPIQNNVRHAVALIKRGQCDFVEKAVFAEEAGAVVALIYDNHPSRREYLSMIAEGSSLVVNIPSLFMAGRDGAKIEQALEAAELTHSYVTLPVNESFVTPFEWLTTLF